MSKKLTKWNEDRQINFYYERDKFYGNDVMEEIFIEAEDAMEAHISIAELCKPGGIYDFSKIEL